MKFRLLVTLALLSGIAGCTFPTMETAESAAAGGYAPATLSPNAVIQHRITDLEQKNQDYLKAAQDTAAEAARLRVRVQEQGATIESLRNPSASEVEEIGSTITMETPQLFSTTESGVATAQPTEGEVSAFEPAIGSATEPSISEMPATVSLEYEEPEASPFEPAAPVSPFAETAPSAEPSAFGAGEVTGEAAIAPTAPVSPFAEMGTTTPPAEPVMPTDAEITPEMPVSPFAPSATPAPVMTPEAPFPTPAAEVTPMTTPMGAVEPSVLGTAATEPIPTPVNPFAPAATPAPEAAMTPAAEITPGTEVAPAAGTTTSPMTGGPIPTPAVFPAATPGAALPTPAAAVEPTVVPTATPAVTPLATPAPVVVVPPGTPVPTP